MGAKSGVVLDPPRKIGDITITITLDLERFRQMVDDLSNPNIIDSTARVLD
jgi:hypothetical protein